MAALKKAGKPFRFVTQVNMTEITGRKARDLKDLVKHLKEVTGSVIYYHTHRFLEQHQFLSPEPPNDFAYWVTTALQEVELGELLAGIDTVRFNSIRALREKIIETIERHRAANPVERVAPAGQELYFMQSISFMLPTPYEARDLSEFLEALKKVSIHSLYHHIFEGRIRPPLGVNDFSNWMENDLGEIQLARAIHGMDPYTQTLDSLRHRIIALIEARLREVLNA